MTAIESRSEAVWWAKQSAKGTPATTADKRGRKVGGDMNVNRDDANQNWSENSRFGTAEDFVSTILGNGNPTVQGQPGAAASLAYLFSGQESVVAVAGPTGLYDHTITPADTGAFWTTWWKKVGQTVGPVRQKFNDARLVSLRFEASSAQKVLQCIPTFVSLDPGEVFAVDPVKTEDVERAMIYTEGASRFKLAVGGSAPVTFRAHSSFAFTLNDAATPWYGDAVFAQDVAFGASSVDLEGITILVDQQGKDYYDELIYGQTAPAAGTKPRVDLPVYGSYEIDLQRGSVYDVALTGATAGTFTLTVDGVTSGAIQWNSTAAQMQTVLEAMPNLLPGDVVVTGGPGPATVLRAIFSRVGRVVTGTFTGLTGGTNSVTSRGLEKEFKVTFPSVKWSPDVAIAGNPDGGAVELALGAQARQPTTGTIYTILSRIADPAF